MKEKKIKESMWLKKGDIANIYKCRQYGNKLKCNSEIRGHTGQSKWLGNETDIVRIIFNFFGGIHDNLNLGEKKTNLNIKY